MPWTRRLSALAIGEYAHPRSLPGQRHQDGVLVAA
jgi:hypothetical protein